MRLAPFLCLGGVEIADLARTTSYGACEFFDNDCPCPALDEETYVSPEADPAAWYDAAYPESADFLGLLPSSITMQPTGSRGVAPMFREGSLLSAQKLSGRVVEVQGWMVARTTEAAWWGERWLTEALNGSGCQDCVQDTLEVLPFCRQDADPGYDYALDFRTLVCAALVDGPRFSELSDSPDYMVQTVQFQIVSQMPWLYLPKTTCLEDEPLGLVSVGPDSCALTTTEWMDGTFRIEVTAETAVTGLSIVGRVSLDDSCPVDPPGDSVMPCFTYTVGSMAAGDKVLIDGTRRQAHYIRGGERFPRSLLPFLDFEGPFIWPDASTCTTLCVTLEVATGDATATVDTYLREN